MTSEDYLPTAARFSNSQGKNTFFLHAKLLQSCLTAGSSVGCHFILQGIVPTQELNPTPSCLCWQADYLPLVPPGKPVQVSNVQVTIPKKKPHWLCWVTCLLLGPITAARQMEWCNWLDLGYVCAYFCGRGSESIKRRVRGEKSLLKWLNNSNHSSKITNFCPSQSQTGLIHGMPALDSSLFQEKFFAYP